MKLDVVVFIFVVTFSHIQFSDSAASCVTYSGTICDKEKKPGVPHTYSIPDGKTQQQLEKEITDTLQEHSFKYIACKDHLKYLLCATKFKPCGENNVPLCNDTCQVAKKSVCFEKLKENSKIYQWYHKEFLCGKSQNDCKILYDKNDNAIKELSCKMETELQQEDNMMLRVSMVTQNTPTPALNRHYLLKHLPQYLNKDLMCCPRINRKLSSLVKGKIRTLRNLDVDKIGDRTITGYCYSRSTKTKVIPVASLQNYKPAVNASFKNVQVVVIQRGRTAPFLAILGTDNVCLDNGNFEYAMHEDLSNGLQYRGVSSTPLQWKWVELSENNPERNNYHVNTLMLKMGVTQSLTLSNPTQTIQWDGESNDRLFEDKNSSLVVRYYDDYLQKSYTVSNIQTEILVGGKKKSTAFHLTMSSGVSLSRTMKMLVSEEINAVVSFESYEKFLIADRVEYFFQVQNGKLNLPSAEYFRSMKKLIMSHKSDAIVAKLFGKIRGTSKSSWLEPVQFVLKYKLTSADKEEYRLELNNNYSVEECRMKMQQNWTNFEDLLHRIDTFAYDKIKISRKTIECTVCCADDVFTLKAMMMDEIDVRSMTASLTFVILNKNKEITYSARHYSLFFLLSDQTSQASDETKRRYLSHRKWQQSLSLKRDIGQKFKKAL